MGPGFTITLTMDGAPVESLPAGTYEFQIEDLSDAHNFHLTGAAESTRRPTSARPAPPPGSLTLEAGEYTYVCDPHASSMNGSFTVT